MIYDFGLWSTLTMAIVSGGMVTRAINQDPALLTTCEKKSWLLYLVIWTTLLCVDTELFIHMLRQSR